MFNTGPIVPMCSENPAYLYCTCYNWSTTLAGRYSTLPASSTVLYSVVGFVCTGWCFKHTAPVEWKNQPC